MPLKQIIKWSLFLSLLFQVFFGNIKAEVHSKNYMKQSWLILPSVFTFETVFIPRHFVHFGFCLASASCTVHWCLCHTQMKAYESCSLLIAYNRWVSQVTVIQRILHIDSSSMMFFWCIYIGDSHDLQLLNVHPVTALLLILENQHAVCWLHSPVALQQEVSCFVQICMLWWGQLLEGLWKMVIFSLWFRASSMTARKKCLYYYYYYY